MWNKDEYRYSVRRIVALVLCAFITIAYMPGMVYALEDQAGDMPAAEDISDTEQAGEVSEEEALTAEPAEEEPADEAEAVAEEPDAAAAASEEEPAQEDKDATDVPEEEAAIVEPLAKAAPVRGEGNGEEIRLEDCQIDFDVLYYHDTPFFSVDRNEKLSLDDLGISVMHGKEVIDPAGYELKFAYYAYDENIDDVVLVDIDPPLGVIPEDLEAGYAYTEYCVTATAVEGSGLTGSTRTDDGYFCIRDKHSLQWVGAYVTFENGTRDSWRARDRFWIGAGKMTAPEVAAVDDKGKILTEGTDYSLTYYRTAYDPDNDDPDGDGNKNNNERDYLAEDSEHRLDEMPTEPGHYFITIDGTGDYTGHARVLFDIVDYEPINVDYNGDRLWSDSTKELHLNIPDGVTGDVRLSGTANTDWGNTVFDFELNDDCYEYNASTGLLVIDGQKALNSVGRGAWLDLKIELVDSSGALVARGLASFEIKEAIKEYDFEGDRNMVPGWDGNIEGRRWAREENAEHPDGIDGEYFVKSVKVLQGAELLDADIDGDGYLQKNGDQWNYRIKDWSKNFNYDAGPVKMEITYEDLDKEVKSYTITVNVVPELYEIWLNSDDNRYEGLPGHSFDMTAPARHVYFDEKGDYHDDAEGLKYKWFYAIGFDLEAQGKGNNGSRDWEPEWTAVPAGGLTDEFADFKVDNKDNSKGNLKFKSLTDGQAHDEFYVRAVLVGEDNETVLASVWEQFNCHNEYMAIYPTSFGDLDVGESTDYMTFELRHYSTEYDELNNGYVTLDNANFTWYFDEEALKINEQYTEGGEEFKDVEVKENQTAHGNSFKLTRLRDWDVNFRVEARWTDQEGNINQKDQNYHFNWKNYDFRIDRESDFVFTDGTSTLNLSGDLFESEGWMDRFDLVIEAGTGEWKYESEAERDVFNWKNKLTEGDQYTVSADGKTITLNGGKLKDLVDNNIRVAVSLKMKGSDDVIRDSDAWCWVRDPWVEYPNEDCEMLPGWDRSINGHDRMHVENSEHPDGDDLWHDVTSVEVTGGEGFLDPKNLTSSGGKTYLNKIIDENDENNFWYSYRIKDLKDLDPAALGDVEFKVNYKLDPVGEESGSYTFKVSVVTDIYELFVDSVDGRNTGLPGDTIDLKAGKVIHKYLDERGESKDEEVDADYEWYHEWGNDDCYEIKADTEDSSIAHVTLKAPDDRDDFWEGFGIGVRARSGGKVLTQSSYGLNVTTVYTEILPVRIDDLGIGQSTDVDLKVVRYSAEQGEEDISGEVQFRLFSEGGFIIEDNDGKVEHGEVINGTHIRITRTAHQYDRFDLRVEKEGGTIDSAEVYTVKEYWFSYAEPDLQHYETVYKNAEDNWKLFGSFSEGSTVAAADEVDIVHDGKVLNPAYYDLRIFWSAHDDESGEQKQVEVTDSGVFTYHGNDSSSYYVKAVVNEAGKAVGLEGETQGEQWIDLCSTTSLDPFGPEVTFEGRSTNAGPHPQREYYFFKKGESADPTVKLLGKTLTKGVDYDVFYVDEYTKEEFTGFPAKPGTYTCLIRPAAGSGYTGENGLLCVVVLMDDDTIGDIGYNEFSYDEENDHPVWHYYYDASFDEKYRKLEQIESTPYDDWFYVVPAGTTLEPTVKQGSKVLDPGFFKASYLEQTFDPAAYGGEGAWGPKDGAEWSDRFPTKEGVYFCRLEGKSPYYGVYEAFDLIRIDGEHEHAGGSAVREKETAAGCDVDGGYDEVVYCTVCGKELSRNHVVIPAFGHEWGEWTSVSDTQHQRVCAHDSTHVETEGHHWGAGVIVKRATEEETGLLKHTCTVCGKETTETVPKREPGTEPVNADAEEAISAAEKALETGTIADAEKAAKDAVSAADAAVAKAEADLAAAAASGDENSVIAATQDLADAKASKAKAEALEKEVAAKKAAGAADAAKAAADKAAKGTPDAVNKAKTAAEAASDAAKAAQEAAEAANAALEAVKAAGYDAESDEYKAAEKAAADAEAAKKTADSKLAAANTASANAQKAYNSEVAAEKARQGTPDKKIPKMKGLKKSKVKKTSITVKWTKLTKKKLKSSKATKYEIWVCPDTKFGKANTRIYTVSKSKSSKSCTGLRKNTKYYVRIRAIRVANGVKYVGTWSSRKTIKTAK